MNGNWGVQIQAEVDGLDARLTVLQERMDLIDRQLVDMVKLIAKAADVQSSIQRNIRELLDAAKVIGRLP